MARPATAPFTDGLSGWLRSALPGVVIDARDEERPRLRHRPPILLIGGRWHVDALLGDQATDEDERTRRGLVRTSLGDGVEADVVTGVDAPDDALIGEAEPPSEVGGPLAGNEGGVVSRP